MIEEQAKQPEARCRKCIMCGQPIDELIIICQRCLNLWSEERTQRERALKENGRLRTERLEREEEQQFTLEQCLEHWWDLPPHVRAQPTGKHLIAAIKCGILLQEQNDRLKIKAKKTRKRSFGM